MMGIIVNCGYNLEDGRGGYCYSNKTHMKICDENSIEMIAVDL